MSNTDKFGQKWNEEELNIALFLYFQLPFGKLNSSNRDIQHLAKLLGRSNNSVAMKLCNFASLDQKITASGRKGLVGASKLDKLVYENYLANWTAQVDLAERYANAKSANNNGPNLPDSNVNEHAEYDVPSLGESTRTILSKQRIGQDFFRMATLVNYEESCCITGLSDIRLLIASHIRPWSVDVHNRHNPANGLLLSATFDRAFDRGLITINQDLKLCVSNQLLKNKDAVTREFFREFNGTQIRKSTRFSPLAEFLQWHSENVFEH